MLLTGKELWVEIGSRHDRRHYG